MRMFVTMLILGAALALRTLRFALGLNVHHDGNVQVDIPQSPDAAAPGPPQTFPATHPTAPGAPTWKDHPGFRRAEKWAKTLKTLVQMSLGVLLAVYTGIALLSFLRQWLFDHVALDHFLTDEFPILEIAGVALLFSAIFELCYMLYTEGPDEAVEPLISTTAALLLIRAHSLAHEIAIEPLRLLEVAVYVAIIFALFWIRSRYIVKE